MPGSLPGVAFLLAAAAFGQPSFEVASVKASPSIEGRDGTFTTDPGRLSAHNVTLKRLIFEAWQIPYSQITGGPAWINNDEYDIEAKAAQRASIEQMRLMLQTLLTERFKLQVRSQKKEGRIYALLAAKDGPRLRREPGAGNPGTWRFHGDLTEFANLLAVQLTIPISDDPTTPTRARGSPTPVVNQTGIEGVFDLTVDLKPEPGADAFNLWQRALQEQLGLRLESRKGSFDVLSIEHAERTPTNP
jgi:uncharacterized protein (TIGR03435 family)